MPKKLIIAIDGYSSCGKSSLAKGIAKELGYAYVDTGAMYRAVALYFMENNTHPHDKEEINQALDKIDISFGINPINGASEVYLNGKNVEQEIRMMPVVADNVSRVSAIKEVRKRLVAIQQSLGKGKGIVMDGRDIGTTVFPNADLKIFMTADGEVRAHRRFNELRSKGSEMTIEAVRENIHQRDYQDTHREESPLVMADDAVVLDNTHLTKEEQFEFVLKLVNKKIMAMSPA